MRQTLGLAGNAGELLDVGVPGRDVLVADRPVDAVPVLAVGLEVEVAPAIALAAPQDGTPAQDVATHPVERLLLIEYVGVQSIVVPELAVVLGEPVEVALDRIVAFVELPVAVIAKLVMPGRLVLALVVAYVFDLPAPLEHERL